MIASPAVSADDEEAMRRAIETPSEVLARAAARLAKGAVGFIQIASSTGTTLKRFVLSIEYRINSKGSPDVPGTAEFAAITAAFGTWDAIVNSDLIQARQPRTMRKRRQG